MRVTGNQQRSDKLTVRLITVVPWEVVGDQVVKKYSMMDLGQDSYVLCLQPQFPTNADRNSLLHNAPPWQCVGSAGLVSFSRTAEQHSPDGTFLASMLFGEAEIFDHSVQVFRARLLLHLLFHRVPDLQEAPEDVAPTTWPWYVGRVG